MNNSRDKGASEARPLIPSATMARATEAGPVAWPSRFPGGAHDSGPAAPEPNTEAAGADQDTAGEDSEQALHVTDYLVADDDAYVLINRTLYVSDLDKGDWRETRYRDIRQLSYGVDRRVYLLNDANALLEPQLAHRARPRKPATHLPQGSEHFAVARGGTVAFTSSERPGQIGIIGAVPADAQDGASRHYRTLDDSGIEWIGAPAQLDGLGIASMVYQRDGALQVADGNGALYRQTHGPDTDASAATWEALPLKFPDAEEPRAVQRLMALRGGSVGAVVGAVLYRLELKDQSWHRTDYDAATKAEEIFSQFTSRMVPNLTRRFVLAIPGGAARDTRTVASEGSWIYRNLLPDMAKRDYPGQPLRARWREWFSVHSLLERNAMSASPNSDDKKNFLAELESRTEHLTAFVNRVSAAPPRAAADDAGHDAAPGQALPAGLANLQIDQRLADKVIANAKEILGKLANELRSAGDIFAELPLSHEVHRPENDLALSSNNALYLLHRTYTLLGPATQFDDVATQLQAMLDKGIYLDAGTTKRLKPASPRMKNNWAVWTGKMIADAQLLTLDQSPGNQPLVNYVDKDYPERSNYLGTAYANGFRDIEGVKSCINQLNFISGSLIKDNHRMQRAIGLQGLMLRPTREELGVDKHIIMERKIDALVQVIAGLQDGQKIELVVGSSYGGDAEGTPYFAKLAPDQKVGSANAQLFAAEALLNFNRSKENSYITEATADGYDITLAADAMVQGGFGIKTQHGIGINTQKGPVLVFLYAGINAKVQIHFSQQTNNKIILSLKFDDKKDAPQFLTKLFSGNLGFRDVAQYTPTTKEIRTKTRAVTVKLDIEPLAAAGILLDPSSNPATRFDNRLKLIFAPIVIQLNLSAKIEKTRELFTRADGKRQEHTHLSTEKAVHATHITVVEAQLGNTRDINSAVAPHASINHGGELQTKAPLYIHVRTKSVYRDRVKDSGARQKYDKTGQLTAVTNNYTLANGPYNQLIPRKGPFGANRMLNTYARARPVNDALNEDDMPAMAILKTNKTLWEQVQSIKEDNLPLAVTVELKPRALKQIKALAEATPIALGQQRLKEDIARLANDPGNWRITEIKSEDKLGYSTERNFGVSVLRMSSSARMDFSPAPKVLNISYEDMDRQGGAGQPTFTSSGLFSAAKKLYGRAAQSALPDLLELVKHQRVLALVQDPVSDNLRRRACAPYINDVLDKLRLAPSLDLGKISAEEKEVLAPFFVPPMRTAGGNAALLLGLGLDGIATDDKGGLMRFLAKSDPPAGEIDSRSLAYLLDHPTTLKQFKDAVRATLGQDKREPILHQETWSAWLATRLRTRWQSVKQAVTRPSGPAPMQDPVARFLKDPLHSDDPAIAAQRSLLLPYIDRIVANDAPDVLAPALKQAGMNAYFPENGKVSLHAITSDAAKHAQFTTAIRRAAQQLESDKDEIRTFLATLEDHPLRLADSALVQQSLQALRERNKVGRLDDQQRDGMRRFFPKKGKLAAVKSSITRRTSMDGDLVHKILKDKARFQFFNDGLASILHKQGKETPAKKPDAVAPASKTPGRTAGNAASARLAALGIPISSIVKPRPILDGVPGAPAAQATASPPRSGAAKLRRRR